LNAAERGMSGNTNAVAAKSDYHDGEWRLVLTRSLNLDAANIIDMKKDFRVGFAAWDANNGETDYKHASSEWITILGADHKPAHH
jgi:DMSO reductase family type II enzyme heme b subunit